MGVYYENDIIVFGKSLFGIMIKICRVYILRVRKEI